MKYFIISGEASGSLHAANLAHAIFSEDKEAKIWGWGGENLRKEGVNVLKDYASLAIMGFVEVIRKLPTIHKHFQEAKQQIIETNPDVVILVDFSGFNLRLAKKLKKSRYTGKIFYYISPKLWVWNKKRLKTVVKYIDHMFCILPFEVDFYKKNGYDNVDYIGNPIVDELAAYKPKPNFTQIHQFKENHLIALLPGSRENEIKHVLPIMLSVVSRFPEYDFAIAGVTEMQNLMQEIMRTTNISVPILINKTYDLLYYSKAALVTSGTATLEAALLGTPLVLCYKANSISYAIAKALVNIDFIGLPNLILEKEMVTELIQEKLTTKQITEELSILLNNANRRCEFFYHVSVLKEKVGEKGASIRAAKRMIELLS